MFELLALLLPVAAISGWFAAMRHVHRRTGNHSTASGRSAGFAIKGLNYLLNDKPDHTVDSLLNNLDPGQSSNEARIALGKLYRRAGEVEQAIAVHKHLVTDYSLDHRLHTQALFELGLDFVRAGLFDRAEAAFEQIRNDPLYSEPALQQLLRIYQHEKEWGKAIECTRKIGLVGKTRRGETESQFYCEMASEALAESRNGLARKYLSRALEKDARCVRASLMQARIDISERNYEHAVQTLKDVVSQDPVFVSEVIEPLMECYRHLGNVSEQIEFLEQIQARYPVERITLILAGLIRERDGIHLAEQFMWAEVRKVPSIRGIDNLLSLLMDKPPGNTQETLENLKQLTSRLVPDNLVYRCSQCGFNGQQIHWCCPGCHHWESIRPESVSRSR